MAEIVTDIIVVLVHGAKEIFAIVSNVAAFYSAFIAIVSLLQLISNQGVISGALTWIIISIVTSVITGLIAEALDSAIPSPFRWVVKLIGFLIQL